MRKIEMHWCDNCTKTTEQIVLRHGMDWKVTECTVCKGETAIA